MLKACSNSPASTSFMALLKGPPFQVAELHAELDAARSHTPSPGKLRAAVTMDQTLMKAAQAERSADTARLQAEAAAAAAAEERQRLSLEAAQSRLLSKARTRQVRDATLCSTAAADPLVVNSARACREAEAPKLIHWRVGHICPQS